MSPETIVVFMIGSLLLLLSLGLPLAFLTGSIGTVVLWFLFGHSFFISMITTILGSSTNILYAAVPLFILMGAILESSGIAEDLFAALHAWLGVIRGGLAMGTVIICCIFAAMVGIAGAEIVIMGIIALPNMLKYNYDKRIALGTILAGGTLGQLIPPSLLFIAYGAEAGVSVGGLFKGGVPAGLILSGLFILYIAIRAGLQKDLCPTIPKEERLGLYEKFVLLRGLILPALLIVFVLGSIFTGIATPSEAAAVGVVGAVISAIVNRRFDGMMVKNALVTTLKVNCMIMWVIFGAKCFSLALAASGGIQVLQTVFLGMAETLGAYGIIALMLFTVFILGLFLEPITIIIVTVPIFDPLLKALALDPLWFGIVYVVTLQLGYITPPFGYSLFYLKGVAPPDIDLLDIYKSVTPFVFLEILGLLIMIKYPQTVTWILQFGR
jgi:tripartite ATP-independent transporter DctM subunit